MYPATVSLTADPGVDHEDRSAAGRNETGHSLRQYALDPGFHGVPTGPRGGQGVSGPRYGIRTTVMLSAPPASTANFTMSAAAPSGSVSALGSASRARSAPSAR